MLLSVTNRAAWRRWLERNHATKDEVWLVSYKKHTGKPSLPYDDALDEALCFGWIDNRVKRLDADRYLTRFTPRRPGSQWSEANAARYRKLRRAGLVTEAGKRAFTGKSRVYTPVTGKNAYEWHRTHTLPKHPTLRQRIAWHREHQKHCGCRPVPKRLLPYLQRLTEPRSRTSR